MTQMIRAFIFCCLWLYSTLFAAWWTLHLLTGDTLWWMALLTSFTPILFLPLLIFWPLGIGVRHPTYWPALLLPTLVFLYLYGVLFIPRSIPAYQRDPPPLRLMTFNIWGGSHRANSANVLLEQNLPDVVTLQELTPMMQRLLLKTVGSAYPYYAFDAAAGHGGLGVLSRYPLERITSDLLIDLSCRQYRVTVDATHHFRLYNCHPESTNLRHLASTWSTLIQQTQDTFRLRTLLAQRLVQEIQAHNEPTIVMGDFNTTDQSDAYHALRRALGDAQRAAGWGFGHTYPSGPGRFRNIPILPRQLRIDMILYSRDFVALQSAVGTTHGESDHLPFTAMLGWRQAPEKPATKQNSKEVMGAP